MTDMKAEDCMSTCSPAQANKAMFKQIGKEAQTHGHWKHWLFAVYLDYSYSLIVKKLPAISQKTYDKKMRKESASNDDHFQKEN